MEDKWLTVEEVADVLKVHIETVRRWIRAGELRASKLGRRSGYRIQDQDLRRFMDERAQSAAGAGKPA